MLNLQKSALLEPVSNVVDYHRSRMLSLNSYINNDKVGFLDC